MMPPRVERCGDGYVERWGHYNRDVLCSFHGSHTECRDECNNLKDNCDSYQYSDRYERCDLINWDKSPLKEKFEAFFFCTKG